MGAGRASFIIHNFSLWKGFNMNGKLSENQSEEGIK
jgi:hypothetical protein